MSGTGHNYISHLVENITGYLVICVVSVLGVLGFFAYPSLFLMRWLPWNVQ